MARRLIERGVRFVQVYPSRLDQHALFARDAGVAMQGCRPGLLRLVQDLKSRGLLDDTLVIWGGEFGRTVYSQGKLTDTNYGVTSSTPASRCGSPAAASRAAWMGETDEFSYNIVKDPVHVRDLQATILHQFGIDHERFTYRYQGLDQKLTGVEKATVVKTLLA